MPIPQTADAFIDALMDGADDAPDACYYMDAQTFAALLRFAFNAGMAGRYEAQMADAEITCYSQAAKRC